MARNMRVPNIHWCNSRPRLPRGFSRLCSGPAPKPSSEIEKPATRTLGITHSFRISDFTGDLMMVSVLLRLKSSGILQEYPNLAAYVARGEARPAYKRAFGAQ